MTRGIYRLITGLVKPGLRIYLWLRKLRGKEDSLRFPERLGVPGMARPTGRLIWLHAASVGESLSMLPLIGALVQAESGNRVLISTGTVTSARLMAERLPNGAFHRYVPVDCVGYVRRFLDHWKPDLALWTESEFWPNLIAETQAAGIPMVLVNGRISPRSFAGWQRARGLIGGLLAGFTLCLGQTDEDTERLLELGAPRAKCLGNLKFSTPPLPAGGTELEALQGAIGGRARWLAASTHPGEEAMLGRAHARLKGANPDLLSILVPRHPARGADIEAELSAQGLTVRRRSQGQAITPETDFYLADTLGELGLFFRLADLVFMGKSLVPLGGQNPLEAVMLDCVVLHGPHMANFQLMSDEMDEMGASICVTGEEALAQEAGRLLGDPDARQEMSAKASAFVQAQAQAQALDRVLAEITGLLDAPPKGMGENEGA